MEEKNLREILEKLDESNRQQLRYAKLQSALLVLTALCFLVLVVLVARLAPQLQSFATEAHGLLAQAETVLANLEQVSGELTEVEFVKMIDDVDALVSSSQAGLEETLEKVNSIDLETLNEAIDGLSKVVEPLAKLFNVFG